jgi:hypothetical protein
VNWGHEEEKELRYIKEEKHLYLILYAIYFTFINQLLVPDSSVPIQ